MMSFDEIMEAMLEKVPDDIDSREGSIIYTALAPFAAMLAEQQVYADNIQNSTMPDTAIGDDLTRICAMFGVQRKKTYKAIRRGIFIAQDSTRIDLPMGVRFGAEGILYVVRSKLEDASYELECQQAGMIGNRYFGALLPVDNVSGLASAELTEVLIAGEDTEADEALRIRFFERINTTPFGGNMAQYREEILAMDGVGDTVIFPTPEKQGGRVHCVIVAPNHKPAAAALVQKVQEQLDPTPHGEGYGIAPIGHFVTVSTVTETIIHVTAVVALKGGYTLERIQAAVESVISQYLVSIAFTDNTVRLSQIEAAVLSVSGVADISETTLNGLAANLMLPTLWDDYQVPQFGAAVLTEAS